VKEIDENEAHFLKQLLIYNHEMRLKIGARLVVIMSDHCKGCVNQPPCWNGLILFNDLTISNKRCVNRRTK
jgi:hypothetical protein